MNDSSVRELLDAAGIEYAVIGAFALAARGQPRATDDLDFLTVDRAVLRDEFWAPLRERRFKVEVRRGDSDDPLAGVVRAVTAAGEQTDVIVGKWKWQGEVIERAEAIMVGGVTYRVPRTADLILLKLYAGGPQDKIDIQHLLDTPDRAALVAEVESNIHRLPRGDRALWRELLTATSG